MVARSSASWRARAARIASGWCSQRVVLPSISVKRNVTVPLGRSAMLSLGADLGWWTGHPSMIAARRRLPRDWRIDGGPGNQQPATLRVDRFIEGDTDG